MERVFIDHRYHISQVVLEFLLDAEFQSRIRSRRLALPSSHYLTVTGTEDAFLRDSYLTATKWTVPTSVIVFAQEDHNDRNHPVRITFRIQLRR